MTVKLNPVVITSDTWRTLVERVNEVVDVLDTKVMSANSANTIGNATLTGSFTANAIFVGSQAVVTVARGVGTGAGLTGGGALSANLTIALNANTIASLAKADTAVQANAFTGKLGLKEKIAVPGDIQASGTANSLTVLAGDGTWREVTAIGDMARVVYDPNNSGSDVYARSNHTGTQSSNTIVGLDASITGLTSAVATKMTRTIYDPNLVEGDVYARANHTGTQPANTITGLANVATQGTYASLTSRTAIEFGTAQSSLTDAQRGQARANIDISAISGDRNYVINGALDHWTRGTSFTGLTAYTADCFRVYQVDGTLTTSRLSAIGAKWGPAHGVIQLEYNGGSTATPNVYTRLEDARTLAGKRVTVGVRTSATVGTGLTLQFCLVRNFGAGGSPAQTVIDWTDVGAIGSGGVVTYPKLSFTIPDVEGMTFGAGHFLEYAFRVKQNVASTVQYSTFFLVEGDATMEADPFSPRHVGTELSLCKRYYQRVDVQFTNYAATAGFEFQTGFPLPVQMRTTPTVGVVSAGTQTNITSLSTSVSHQRFLFVCNAVASGNIAAYNKAYELLAEL